MIAAADLSSGDIVIEIGPGLGFLTAELAARAGKIVAVEIDNELAELLKNFLPVTPNLTIVRQDILNVDIEDLLRKISEAGSQRKERGARYKVVANIPYHITAKITRQFLSGPCRPDRMVLLVQKEVAERMTAAQGKHSLLSLSVQFYGTPRIVALVPRRSFYPLPKVDSAIVKISGISHSRFSVDEKEFWRIVKIGFSSKRKKLVNNLAAGLGSDRAAIEEACTRLAISPDSRAQHLSLDQWVALAADMRERKAK